MDKPTKEQIKGFWEQFGFKAISHKDCHLSYTGNYPDEICHVELTGEYFGIDYPELDLFWAMKAILLINKGASEQVIKLHMHN